MKFGIVAIVALVALLSTSILYGRTPTADPSKFTPIKKLESLRLSYDKSSMAVINVTPPFLKFDIELLFDKVQATKNPSKFVRRYVNTVVIDCKSDLLMVVEARAFDPKDELLFVIEAPEIMENNKVDGSPTTEVMKFFCPAVLELLDKAPSKRPTKQKPGERQA